MRRPFGGADTFLLLLDRENRAAGLPGFNSYAVLRLADRPDIDALRRAVAADTEAGRALRSRVGRTFPFRRAYRDTSAAASPPRVDLLGAPPAGETDPWPSLLNARLAPERGENVRFTVFPVAGDGWRVAFLFSHLLADAKAAERLLVQLSAGGGDASWPDPRSLLAGMKFKGVALAARQHADTLESELGGELLRVIDLLRDEGRGCAGATLVLDPAESVRAVGNGRKAAGYAMEGLWYLACVLAADGDTDPYRTRPGMRYAVPLPMNLDRKGETRAFGNHLVFLFLGASPEEARAPATLAKRLRDRLMQHLKEKGDRAAQAQLELCRHLPLWLHRRLAMNTVGGGWGSLFFTNPGPVAAGLTRFFGAEVQDLAHFPIPTPDPGICAATWTFGDRLHLGLTWIRESFGDERANAILARWRERVLETPA